mmetsp:Transcript_2523/g.5838  ORF Transcript_2523/g.5838 Transcript_2523/m.5838 type:complete len:204 (-) Transcript_2523:151-762(-)
MRRITRLPLPLWLVCNSWRRPGWRFGLCRTRSRKLWGPRWWLLKRCVGMPVGRPRERLSSALLDLLLFFFLPLFFLLLAQAPGIGLRLVVASPQLSHGNVVEWLCGYRVTVPLTLRFAEAISQHHSDGGQSVKSLKIMVVSSFTCFTFETPKLLLNLGFDCGQGQLVSTDSLRQLLRQSPSLLLLLIQVGRLCWRAPLDVCRG